MARQNLPPRGSFAAAAAPADPRPRIDYTIISINYVIEMRWHGDRIVYRGSQAMGVAKRIQPRPQRGAEDAKRHFAQHVSGGLRQNQLIGYGLVVGLNGTGDTLNNIPFTKQSLQAMLERMGVNIRGATIRTGNVAPGMVRATLPLLAPKATGFDVTVPPPGIPKNL